MPRHDAASLPWAEIKVLFEQALNLPAEQRTAFIAEAVSEAAARAELLSLLQHHHASTGEQGFMDGPALASTPPSVQPGQRFGAWEIVRPVGSGGMGEVFEARRADGQYQGRAAIKLLKRGMDSAAVLARFAQERQALARLQHPHIASLLDAGLSDQGLPFFVMAFVEGLPIDEAAQGRTMAQKLDLFLQLADAVSYAHRMLLVHRDLKPGNVLVTPDGQVMLLDFGIAKALDPTDPTDSTDSSDPSDRNITVGNTRPFTPNYASPEQIRGEPVSTATDIYSLGVLLYQLLTGVRPTGRHASTPADSARSVLEDAPTRPSALSPEAVSDPDWLAKRRHLQGDLDNILLKALAKPTELRYASVAELAEDVRRHLRGYPIRARAPTPAYLLQRFIGRNKVSVAAASLAVLAVLGGAGTALWQAQQATAARDDAKRQLADVKQIASELVFRFGDVIVQLPGGAAAQEALLLQTVASLDVALARAPQDSELVVLVAQAMGRLAQLQGNPSLAGPERAATADKTVARALALADQAWPAARGDWRFVSQHLITLLTQAQLLRQRGQVAEGLKALALGAERARQSLAEPLPDAGRANIQELSANLWTNVAHFNDHAVRPSLGRPADALKAFDRAEAEFLALYDNAHLVAAMDEISTPGEPPTAQWRLHNLANVHAGRAVVYQKIDDPAAMRREIEQALPMRSQLLAINPSNVTWRQGEMFDSNTLAIALLRLNEPAQALAASTRAWDIAGQLVSETPASSPWTHARANFAPQHGRALAAAGRHPEALRVYEIGLARLSAQRSSADSPLLQQRQAALQVLRARSLLATGQSGAAVSLLAEARALLDPLVGHAEVRRDAHLARALAWAATAGAPALKATACEAKKKGLDDLQAAAALEALAPDAEALRELLSKPGECRAFT